MRDHVHVTFGGADKTEMDSAVELPVPVLGQLEEGGRRVHMTNGMVIVGVCGSAQAFSIIFNNKVAVTRAHQNATNFPGLVAAEGREAVGGRAIKRNLG